ncbi:nicotinate-nucleotide adenylyltransferase [Peribacillus saganii]|uniref:Probable nicotinate-nucleotide adenylyltransferase n=1 Tax=Peribacillus saganii TaxID=2303992 RepID=A0A372LTX7_9BACI|nr:nicotinate-nucleotide adenylyltransferase [Peribacillus saganii]RFU71655.1 nicotinate-nucleotide adenylyltransferase [Peribacillus saganii]
MKKAAILGGTFNPPHIGHLLIGNEVLHSLQLDEVRFMPNHIPPHKAQPLDVSDDDRVRMLELSIEGNSCFTIEKVELEREGPSYTYDSIKMLRKIEPDTEFYFIIGADMIEYLPKWHRIDELMELIQFVGVKRPQYMEHTDYPIIMVDSPQLLLSSSLIRERIKDGVTIRYLVTEKVRNYIEEKKLYGS